MARRNRKLLAYELLFNSLSKIRVEKKSNATFLIVQIRNSFVITKLQPLDIGLYHGVEWVCHF